MFVVMDFTIRRYKALLQALLQQGFSFQTYSEFSEHEDDALRSALGLIILRHDVDKLPHNSLRFAKIQADIGIKGTYYFRMHPQSWDEGIIKEIAASGHEVGYHYETMDTASAKLKVRSLKFKVGKENPEYDQLLDLAYEEFCRNLEKFRKIAEIKTISMHGSPLSAFDNRAIWKKYSYKELGLVAEPYLI